MALTKTEKGFADQFFSAASFWKLFHNLHEDRLLKVTRVAN